MRAVKKNIINRLQLSKLFTARNNHARDFTEEQLYNWKNSYSRPLNFPIVPWLTDSVYLQTQSPFLLRCHIGIYFHMPEQSGFILRHLHLFFTNLEFLRIPYQAFN